MKPTDRTGSDPWKKARGNILDFFRRKPKDKPPIEPLKMETEMTKINELIATSKKLLAALLTARADIEDLKKVNAAFAEHIRELEAKNAADDAAAQAFMDEAMGAIDAGGSTGGVVG